MTNESPSGALEADPAAVFAIALSVCRAVHEHEARNPAFNLSDAFNGVDEFMRVVMRVGNRFEEWACEHVAFEETDEVWSYHLEEHFGVACLSELEAHGLATCEDADCLRIAWRLGLPLRVDGRLPVPFCIAAQNPLAGSGFRAFRIQTFRVSVGDEGVELFTESDELCDEEFGPPTVGLYGVDDSGLLEHIADRPTYRDAAALARKLAPGL